MDYLPYFLKRFDLDLRPSNGEWIDVKHAADLLYPGAHVATSNPYEHYHHGIVVDVETPEISLIHFWGPDKEHSRIQTTTLPIFLAGSLEQVGQRTRQLYLINYENDSIARQEATVNTAKELLSNPDGIVYDLAGCNCESFARFCRTKEWKSEQVQRMLDLLKEKSMEIYEKIKDADESNRRNISTLIEALPSGALNPTERELYEQFCQQQHSSTRSKTTSI